MVLADDENDLARKPREEEGLLAGGVPSPDDEDALSAVEHPVAGRAIRDPVAGEALLAFETGAARCRTSGENHRSSVVRTVRSGYSKARGIRVDRDVADALHDDARPEVLRLLTHGLDE